MEPRLGCASEAGFLVRLRPMRALSLRILEAGAKGVVKRRPLDSPGMNLERPGSGESRLGQAHAVHLGEQPEAASEVATEEQVVMALDHAGV